MPPWHAVPRPPSPRCALLGQHVGRPQSRGSSWGIALRTSASPLPGSERLIAEALYPYPEGPGHRDQGRAGPAGPGALTAAARRRGVTERQVVLAWLLTRSPQVLPIPGSGDPEHVERNIAAASIELTAEEIRAITLAALSR
jgi:diketogulonate reductase-like aldo/keto reductase